MMLKMVLCLFFQAIVLKEQCFGSLLETRGEYTSIQPLQWPHHMPSSQSGKSCSSGEDSTCFGWTSVVCQSIRCLNADGENSLGEGNRCRSSCADGAAIIESSKSRDIGIFYGLSFLGNAEPRNLQQTETESK